MSNNKDKVVRVSPITINVGLDANNIPVYMDWQAVGSPDTPEPVECKAFSLALFDKDQRDTFKIDLWTEDMQVVEMDRFIFHAMRSLADTYFKATRNMELANDMQKFVQYFGEKTGFLTKDEQ